MNKFLRKIRKIFYRYQIRPGPRFGRLLIVFEYILSNAIILIHRHFQQEILTTYPTVDYRFSQNFHISSYLPSYLLNFVLP